MPRLLFHPIEYRWICAIVNLARRDRYARQELLKWNSNQKLPMSICNHPSVFKHGHSGGTISWAIMWSKRVVEKKVRIGKHNSGIKY
jgi:hypothetical protein